MIQSSNVRVDTRNLPSIASISSNDRFVHVFFGNASMPYNLYFYRKGEEDEGKSNRRRRNICMVITAILVLAIVAAVGAVYIMFIRNSNAAASITTTTTGKQYIKTTWLYHE
ncbi:unnamed protein product [Rotaria socialis]|uniref:Uncharacterized protein n=1 Tax=Rotaria socialis TaxID=392032 RepID=A0A817QK65_9BILA|nr:unnamed protein product [Rotaria socialis]